MENFHIGNIPILLGREKKLQFASQHCARAHTLGQDSIFCLIIEFRSKCEFFAIFSTFAQFRSRNPDFMRKNSNFLLSESFVFSAKIQISDLISSHRKSDFWTKKGLLPQCVCMALPFFFCKINFDKRKYQKFQLCFLGAFPSRTAKWPRQNDTLRRPTGLRRFRPGQ